MVEGGGGEYRVICWISNHTFMSHRRQSLMTLVAEYPLHPCPFLTVLPLGGRMGRVGDGLGWWRGGGD